MKKILNLLMRAGAILVFGIVMYVLSSGKPVISDDSASAIMSLYDIPDYDGKDSVVVNKNHPFAGLTSINSGMEFSELDRLGRCGAATAIIRNETLATEKRESIGDIKPSGWKQHKYEGIVDSNPPFLYNRSHLIAFMFFGNETNDERNLITGTRHFNADTMLTFETQLVNYIEETGDYCYYRVTPVFDGENLLAKGVLMEAQSHIVGGLEFCVFCYNVQPGIEIDYRTGENWIAGEAASANDISVEEDAENIQDYVANKNSRVLHLPDCEAVLSMKERNKVHLRCTREEALSDGWKPCGMCNP